MAAFKKCDCSNQNRCDHSWWLSHKPKGGKRKRLSLLNAFGKRAKLKSEAEKFQTAFDEEVQSAHRENREPFAIKMVALVEIVTYRDLFEQQYLRRKLEVEALDHVPKADIRSKLRRLLAEFGDMNLNQLCGEAGFATISDYKRKLKASGLEVGSVAQYLAYLRTVLRWAHAHRYLPGDVPFGSHKVTLDLDEANQRHRRLAPGEEAALFASARQLEHEGTLMADRMVFTLDTAARSGEMQFLQREDIDYTPKKAPYGTVTFRGYKMLPIKDRKTGVVSIKRKRTTKNGKDRVLHMTPRVRAILDKSRMRPASHFVFSHDGTLLRKFDNPWRRLVLLAHGEDGVMKKARWSAAQKAALETIDLHWHDLRHEAASRWLANGAPLPTIQLLLGHSDIKTTQRYLNVSEQEFSGQLGMMANLAENATQVEAEQ